MTGVLLAHDGQGACGGHVRDLAHIRGLALEVNRNARLSELHQGTHTHACGNDRVDAVLGKQGDGSHAAAFFVRRVVDDLRRGNRAVFDRHHGKAVAVAKMTRAIALEPARAHGWNSDLQREAP